MSAAGTLSADPLANSTLDPFGPIPVQRRAASRKNRVLLFSLLVVCLNAVGNLALAWGMKRVTQVMGWNPTDYVRAMLNPFVAGGIILLISWLLARMTLMSWADLSFAVPLMAVGYVVAAVLGRCVLHETVTGRQWIGTLLIFAGIALVGTTQHQTGEGTIANA